MSLLFNNYIYLFKYVIFGILMILLQTYSPQIWINQNLEINLDIFLIYLTFLTFSNRLFLVIYYAFLLGLFQDLVINAQMIGVYSLIKSVSVYYIGILKKYNHLWSRKIKVKFLFAVYCVHFIIYYYILINNNF